MAMRVPKKPRKHLLLQRDNFHVRRRRASTNLLEALLQLAIRPGGRQEAHTMALFQEVEAIIGSNMVKMGRWGLKVGALNQLLLLLGLVVHGVELLKRVEGSHALHLLLLLLPSLLQISAVCTIPRKQPKKEELPHLLLVEKVQRRGKVASLRWEVSQGRLTD